jgi:acetyl-CoA carboxylase biotin carboxylase subunit
MKVLVANRGEIAVRIMRACRELGFQSVAVYSDCDRLAPHVRYADQAYEIGANEPAESYLNIDRLIDVAREADVTAVHPGYGFLSENAKFAAACRDANLTFIGPSADVIALMGGKVAARQAAQRAGVPVVPGTNTPLDPNLSDIEVKQIAREVGYPLFVKAVAGGGGRGMRVVREPEGLTSALREARSEAQTAFGDELVYLERQIVEPRHIEVQLLGDSHGAIVPFVERDCSIQRRYQKVVEESPAMFVTQELREQMATAAVALARSVGYVNAGTVEFLLDKAGKFYFLEMNTRLQVEHPVTEMITGVDLVHWQLHIAQGKQLTINPGETLTPRGHAIECRVYAEDPDNGFMPSPGTIRTLRTPSGPGIRDDSGVASGFEVPTWYDPLISKVITWGPDRVMAIARMRRAMDEYKVHGIKTTIPFFSWLLQSSAFHSGAFNTNFIDMMMAERNGKPLMEPTSEVEEVAVVGAALHAYLGKDAAATKQRDKTSAWRRQAKVEALRVIS